MIIVLPPGASYLFKKKNHFDRCGI